VDRPLRLEYVDPASLADNPSNWKVHPPEQLGALEEIFGEVGWAGALLYNESTGRLLDGHGRKQLHAGRPVPVLIGSWSEDQERKILATLDPSGWTAQADRKRLDALLKAPGLTLKTDALKGLMAAVRDTAKLLDEPAHAGDEAKADDETASVIVPLDSIWPSDNAYDVPSLLPELQADQVPGPITTWGTQGARRGMPGTWHFYTSDDKFEPVWKRPQRVLLSRPACVVEPNFSTTDQTPLALSLWHIYRKRWLARYWQQCGLRVFVDLNVDQSLNHPIPMLEGVRVNLLGVPQGWKAYASRAHGNQPETLVDEWEIAREHSGEEHPLFLVVGGGRSVKALAMEHGWVWVPEQLQQTHGKGEAA
jgi:hypothetical protein